MIPRPSLADAQTLLARYAWAVDDRDYALLAEVFTPDVSADYEAFRTEGLDELVAQMTRIHEGLVATQHLVGSVLVSHDGRSRAHVQATLVGRPQGAGGHRELVRVGACYRDRLVPVGRGWRIAERRTQGLWIEGRRDLLPWMSEQPPTSPHKSMKKRRS